MTTLSRPTVAVGELRAPGAPAPAGGIPLCVPEIRGNEWQYVHECLDTGWVSSVGAYVNRFERMLAETVGTSHAVATASGTAALHTALLVAGVEPDDEVLVSTLTFIAPANAVRYVGAWPVFMDAEPRYWQMDPQYVVDFLRRHCRRSGGVWRQRATGRRVRALLPVHVLGHPADMSSLVDVAREHELVVIEDASESLGASCHGMPVGKLGDIACFSFNGNKLLTTGGGGMLVTDDPAYAARARYLTTQAKDDPIEYVHGAVGYNYRLTNVQAAIGVAQLEQLDRYVEAKRRIADRYADAFDGIPGLCQMAEAPWARATFWMYTMLVNPVGFGRSSRDLLKLLDLQRIQARPLWQPLHRSPAHAGSPLADCPVADELYEAALSLPCSVGLSEADQQRVIAVVRAAAVDG